MKLFAIRIENGDTVLLLAATAQEALSKAALTDGALEELRQEGWRFDHAATVQSGIGPQKYEITELTEFYVALTLNEEGEFEVSDQSLETWAALIKFYPIFDRVGEGWPLGWGLEHPRKYKRAIRDAVSQERTRLGLPEL